MGYWKQGAHLYGHGYLPHVATARGQAPIAQTDTYSARQTFPLCVGFLYSATCRMTIQPPRTRLDRTLTTPRGKQAPAWLGLHVWNRFEYCISPRVGGHCSPTPCPCTRGGCSRVVYRVCTG